MALGRGSYGTVLAAGVLLLVGGLALSARPGAIDDLSWLALAIVVAVAKIGGDLAGRVGQPAVLGELLGGVVLGNLPGVQRLAVFGADSSLDILGRLGMLLLVFEVGLDLSVRDLFAVGKTAFFVALVGTCSSFALGWGVALAFLPGAPIFVQVFLGAAITATSVGITARVLKDLGASRTTEAKIILAAAVVDDVLALVVLGLVTGWVARGATGAAEWRPIVALLAKTIGFLTVVILLGVTLTPAWFRRAAKLRTSGALLATGLCFCFFLSWAANAIGLAALIGAFAAGLILEDTHSKIFVQRGERPLGELLEPVTAFLVPVFFVLVGFRTNVATLVTPAALGLPLTLTAAAIVGKLACSAAVFERGVRKLTVGVGMMPRGEVTLIFAALGSTLRVNGAPLLDSRGYAALVTVVIVTTLVTPAALKWSTRATGSAQTIS